jgi:hypothetical protein
MAEKQKESEYILERKRWALQSLEINLKGLEAATLDLKKKIETQGIEANYSISSDISKWAQRIHTREYELHILSQLLVYCCPDHDIIEQ